MAKLGKNPRVDCSGIEFIGCNFLINLMKEKIFEGFEYWTFLCHPEEYWREGVPEGPCSREGDLPCVGCGR